MTATTSSFIEKPLRLAGVDLASRSQSIRMQSRIQSALETAFSGSAHETKQLYQMLNDVPARTVFADDEGLQYTMMLTPAGPIMVPWNTGQALTPATYSNDGGFLSTGLLSQPQTDSDGSTFHQDLHQAALDDLAANNKSKGINPLDLAKSLGQSLLQNLAGKGLQELFKGAKLSDLLTQAASTNLSDLAKSLATGIGSHLASMGIDMAFNACWNVDDESSAAEHVGHTLAGQGLQTVIGSVISAQMTETASSLGNIKGILDKYLPAEPQQKLAALRVGDVDIKGNKVVAGSNSVLIEGTSAARHGDIVEKTGTVMTNGSATVFINGANAGCKMNSFSNDGYFPAGALRTYIGGPAIPEVPVSPTASNNNSQSNSAPTQASKEKIRNSTSDKQAAGTESAKTVEESSGAMCKVEQEGGDTFMTSATTNISDVPDDVVSGKDELPQYADFCELHLDRNRFQEGLCPSVMPDNGFIDPDTGIEYNSGLSDYFNFFHPGLCRRGAGGVIDQLAIAKVLDEFSFNPSVQCCYDTSTNRLNNSGTFDFSSPNGIWGFIGHIIADMQPGLDPVFGCGENYTSYNQARSIDKHVTPK